ncbi:MAG: MFS transporter [Dehalococcoidia bacterium]|nr:MFS transporter [Dehalococcoidia bacterium]MDP7083643.1 MFS transporter [Dehalococcoidia bacterium]MDP7199539.1 MFS transporter [Dehalococcoidia bacterium]HJN85911.1 MFS transporter [Dehalococcoidia bacterium]
MEEAIPAPAEVKQTRGFVLSSLTFGHAVQHLYDHGFPVFTPTITSTMGLSNLQVASLLGIRQAGFGVVNLGGGIFVDMLRSQWGLILTCCMLWSAIAFAALGAAYSYPLLIVAVILTTVPGALWHLPATAALSQRFPDRRGFAISMHGLGANAGNVLGPLLAGGLLELFFWRNVLFVYTTPALLVAVFTWWSLKDLGKGGGGSQGKGLGAQFHQSKELLRNPVILWLVLAAAFRGVGLNALFNWTPFYLEEELGMGHFNAGVHFALLTGMGIVSAPVLGVLSDKFGRKQVLAPGTACAAILAFLVVGAGDTFLLPVVLAGLGLFSFALHQILLAAVLDVTGKGTEATVTGLIFGINGALGGVTPFIATVIIDHFGGYGSVYYYSGALTAVAALIVILVPLSRKPAGPAS